MISAVIGAAGLAAGLDRALEDRARLHLRDFGIAHREPHAAEAEHRIDLMQFGRAGAQLLRADAHRLGDLRDLRFGLRQEFVQRRIEQADRDRQARHDLEQFGEVLALHRQQLGERRAAAFLGVGEDHLAHRDDALALEEHVFGPAKPDAFGAEAARGARVQRRLGVGAHLHAPDAVGPYHQRREIAGEFGLDHRDRAGEHLAGGAVDRQHVALLQRDAAGGHGLLGVVDADRARAGDAGLAHAARDHGRMRGHAAARRHDALGRVHAVDVLGARLDAHQDRLAPRLLAALRPRRRRIRSRRSPRPAKRAGRSRSARAWPWGRSSDAATGRARRARRG